MKIPQDWTDEQGELFALVYRFAVANQDAIRHPRTREIPMEEWATICHNAAFTAAEFMETDDLTVSDLETGAVLAVTPRLSS